MTTLPIEVFPSSNGRARCHRSDHTVQIALIVLFGLVVERLVGLRAAMRL